MRRLPKYKRHEPRPTLPSLRNLHRSLGLASASIDMIEFSLRDVQVSASESDSGTIREYIARRKKQHVKNIASSPTDWRIVQRDAAHNYVLTLHLVADRYFDDAIVDIRSIRHDEPAHSDQTLDSMARALTLLTKTERNRHQMMCEHSILEYFRLARNAILHPGPKAKAKAEVLRHRLLETFADTLAREYPGIGAPNALTGITFDDFRLYARVLLRFANSFNDALMVTPKIYALYLMNTAEHLRALRNTKSKHSKMAHQIGVWLTSALDLRNVDFREETVKEIARLLADEGNKKQRRRASQES